jgi:hypothetical protein
MATPPDPHTDAEALSEGWRIAGPPPGGSPARRVLFAVRRLAAALLRPQETFNAAVVRRLNTLHQANEEALHRSADAAGAARATAAAGDHALEQTRRVHEAFAARERRSNDALDAVLATQRELRTAVGVLQQATHALQREVARRPDGPASSTPATGTGHAAAPAPAGGFDSHRYVGFEDQFRGDPEEIRRRLLDYPSIFAGATDVLDMGCGRGEFLALLEERTRAAATTRNCRRGTAPRHPRQATACARPCAPRSVRSDCMRGAYRNDADSVSARPHAGLPANVAAIAPA